jgi:hypothetical protein
MLHPDAKISDLGTWKRWTIMVHCIEPQSYAQYNFITVRFTWSLFETTVEIVMAMEFVLVDPPFIVGSSGTWRAATEVPSVEVQITAYLLVSSCIDEQS